MSSLVFSRPTVRTVLALPLFAAAALGVGLLLGSKDLEATRAATILTVLVAISLVLFTRVASRDPLGRALLAVLWLSFALKLGAMTYRFLGGLLADAFAYNNAGQRIAEELARGEWPQLGEYGTAYIRLLAGLVYYAFGVSFSGISILWTWLGMVGMLFFYLAFRTAFPLGYHRLYMVLIFLFPSMLLWTSSLGKDALMVLFLGMAAYGAARLRQGLGLPAVAWLALGLLGMLPIRPHLAAVFAVALAASSLILPIRAGLLTPVIRIVGIGAVAAVSVLIVSTARSYVGLEELGTGEVFAFIERQQEATAGFGESGFQQVNPRSPVGFALAIPTVLFRPFPWEAHNANARLAAAEGFALLLLTLYRLRSIRAALGALFRHSYVLMVVVYALLFIFFFTAIGNFGIIARQRAQLFPFFFMLLAYLPPPAAPGGTGRQHRPPAMRRAR